MSSAESDVRSALDLLPDELLGQIFKESKRGRRRIGDVLSKVNRKWREVSVGHAILWTDIVFGWKDDPPFKRAELYLQRSRTMPLDIEIAIPAFMSSPVNPRAGKVPAIDAEDIDFLDDLTDELSLNGTNTKSFMLWGSYLHWALTLITPHVGRWKSFAVAVMGYEHDIALFYFLYTHLSALPPPPMLQHFHLMNTSGGPDKTSLGRFTPSAIRDHFFESTPFAGNMPALKTFRLNNVHLSWEDLQPFPHLTYMELSSHNYDIRPNFEEFLKMLRGCPCLEVLNLNSGGPHARRRVPDDLLPEEVAHLPKLHRVVLGNINLRDVLALWKRMYTPALRHLTLDLDVINNQYTEFLNLLCSPDPVAGPGSLSHWDILSNIHTLSLHGLTGANAGIPKVFHGLTSLRKLFLYRIYDTVLSALSVHKDKTTGRVENPYQDNAPVPPPSDEFYCQGLREVIVKGPLKIIGKGALKKFTSARHAAGYAIATLRVDMNDDDDIFPDPRPGEVNAARAWITQHIQDNVDNLVIAKDGDGLKIDEPLPDFARFTFLS